MIDGWAIKARVSVFPPRGAFPREINQLAIMCHCRTLLYVGGCVLVATTCAVYFL